MKQKILHKLIDSEIDWNKEQPLIKGYTEEFRAGFIAGLIQANRIIFQAYLKEKGK